MDHTVTDFVWVWLKYNLQGKIYVSKKTFILTFGKIILSSNSAWYTCLHKEKIIISVNEHPSLTYIKAQPVCDGAEGFISKRF